MFDFDRFKSEVYNDYISKKEMASLPSRMGNPTPANLRDYAIHCLNKGLTLDDKIVFQEFFNEELKYEDLEKAIKKTDLGKLKTIQYYLIGKTKNPDEIIVKLMAVLTDYQPRPFYLWKDKYSEKFLDQAVEPKKLNPTIPQQTLDSDTKPDNREQEVNINEMDNKKHAWFNKKTIASSIGGIALLSIGYIAAHQSKSIDCAYWNGEQFISVDCSEANVNHEIIHIKDKAILSIKKITQPDTLTKKDTYKVWYSKTNHKIEFFTAPGYHPIYREKPLKPATSYIIEKYSIDTTVSVK